MNRVEQTKKYIMDVVNHREPQKIPVGIFTSGWPFHYSGQTYESVVDDPEKCSKAYCKLFDDISVDMTISNTVGGAPYKALNAMGIKDYILSADKNSVVHNQAGHHFMGLEVYDEIIADANHFVNVTYPNSILPVLSEPKEVAYETMKEALIKCKTSVLTDMMIGDYLRNEKQILGFLDESINYFFSPFNAIFDYYRGIKDSLTDLRRHPQKVKAACDALWELQKMYWDPNPEECRDQLKVVYGVYHSECFLSPKQFDNYVFEYMKDVTEPLLNAGQKLYLLGEGRFMHTIDRLRDLPKDSVLLQLDQDDPFEVKKKIGDWATIICGISLDLLQLGSKQECIDYVKKSFDELAPGGGFIFMPNQQLVSGADAKIENIIAVFEEADKLSRQ